MRRALSSYLPPFLHRRLARWRQERTYRGDYRTWAEASAVSQGYSAESILARVVEATRAVRDGRAVWERDAALFHSAAAHEPLLAALRKVAAAKDGRLRVLDFGGALGSAWWQHRRWLEDLREVRWGVVEQSGFVAAGRREFMVGALSFFEDLDDGFTTIEPDVVLLSSVLAYLEQPERLLAEVARRDCDYLILDRVGFTRNGRHRLTVQYVPESLGGASYPCWFFDRAHLLAPLEARWRVVAEWPTFDGEGRNFEYRGLMFERKS